MATQSAAALIRRRRRKCISYLKYYRDIVLTGLFHTWERRLHAVSKDRVVRPFEWGLDWIEPNGAQTRGLCRTAPARLGLTGRSEQPAILRHSRAHRISRSGPAWMARRAALSFPSAMHTPLSRKQHGARVVFPRRGGSCPPDPPRIPAACRARAAAVECRSRRTHRPVPPAEPLRHERAAPLPSLPSRAKARGIDPGRLHRERQHRPDRSGLPAGGHGCASGDCLAGRTGIRPHRHPRYEPRVVSFAPDRGARATGPGAGTQPHLALLCRCRVARALHLARTEESRGCHRPRALEIVVAAHQPAGLPRSRSRTRKPC